MIKRKAIAAIMVGLATRSALAACGNNAISSSTVSEPTSSNTPEWAVVEGNTHVQDAATQTELPTRYDMREKGLVTSVKRQNPWGTWAHLAARTIKPSWRSARRASWEGYGYSKENFNATAIACTITLASNCSLNPRIR